MLSQYDEFPVHQSSRPFASIPSTDYMWDDGYFFGAYNADAAAFLYTGMRVNPNVGTLGGYAGIVVDGRQHTARFSRPWRTSMDTTLGPLRYEFVEPLRVIRLSLGDNDSELTFDFRWVGAHDAFLEPHHFAERGGRVITDQTRYYQTGTAEGWIEIKGRRFELTPDQWYADRDHSWGLYAQRWPLVPDGKWLMPATEPVVRRGLRWASWWGAPGCCGMFSVHETQDGTREPMNDTFGTPLTGRLRRTGDTADREIVEASQHLDFHPGTRALRRATWQLVDDRGAQWTQVYDVVPGGCWLPATIGYWPGSWKDGGSMFTYHGCPDVVQEFDDFDFSPVTFDHVMYNGDRKPGSHCYEYLARTTTTDPNGIASVGSAHIELFIPGRYAPAGFEAADAGESTP